jgi:hypothetical protein
LVVWSISPNTYLSVYSKAFGHLSCLLLINLSNSTEILYSEELAGGKFKYHNRIAVSSALFKTDYLRLFGSNSFELRRLIIELALLDPRVIMASIKAFWI